MTIRCAWASQDENCHGHGGQAGDQTGREVKTGDYYNFGQTKIIRCKNRKNAHKMANAAKWIAENNNTGYDQYQRTTLYSTLKSMGFENYKKLSKKVETDCSALMAVVANIAGYNVSKDIWTGNLEAAFVATGDFQVLTKPVNRPAMLLKGDIILNPSAHVIMAITSGTQAASEYGKKWKTNYEVNFRSDASLNSKHIYARIPKGTTFRGFAFGDYWIYAYYDGKWGYVKRVGKTKIFAERV